MQKFLSSVENYCCRRPFATPTPLSLMHRCLCIWNHKTLHTLSSFNCFHTVNSILRKRLMSISKGKKSSFQQKIKQVQLSTYRQISELRNHLHLPSTVSFRKSKRSREHCCWKNNQSYAISGISNFVTYFERHKYQNNLCKKLQKIYRLPNEHRLIIRKLTGNAISSIIGCWESRERHFHTFNDAMVVSLLEGHRVTVRTDLSVK